MIDNEDYRLYLEEKFEGLISNMHAQFEKVQDTLDIILKQAQKTNDRVTKLEERAEKTEKNAIKHLMDCPQIPKIDKINNDLEEYRMLKKYPKIAVIILVIVTLGAIYGFIRTTNTITRTEEKLTTEIRTTEGVSKVTRGGYVKYNDEGFSDSIKIK